MPEQNFKTDFNTTDSSRKKLLAVLTFGILIVLLVVLSKFFWPAQKPPVLEPVKESSALPFPKIEEETPPVSITQVKEPEVINSEGGIVEEIGKDYFLIKTFKAKSLKIEEKEKVLVDSQTKFYLIEQVGTEIKRTKSSFSQLKEGDTASVFTKENIKDKKEYLAAEVEIIK